MPPKLPSKQPPQQTNTTALIPHFNEPFIRESVLSIAPFVEEVIVADSGSDDRYLEWLYSAATSAGNIHIYHLDLREQPFLHKIRNFLHEKARTEWVLIYDSDQIAYQSGERCMSSLYDMLENESGYDYFSTITPYVCGDYQHYISGKPFHKHRAILYRNGLVHYQLKNNIERFDFTPLQGLNIKGHYCLSTDLKPIERMAFRGIMDRFVLENPDPQRLSTLWEWLYYHHTSEYPLNQQQVLERKLRTMNWQRDRVLTFEPFDYDKWGPHPELLFECEMFNEFVLTEVEGGYTRERYPFFY